MLLSGYACIESPIATPLSSLLAHGLHATDDYSRMRMGLHDSAGFGTEETSSRFQASHPPPNIAIQTPIPPLEWQPEPDDRPISVRPATRNQPWPGDLPFKIRRLPVASFSVLVNHNRSNDIVCNEATVILASADLELPLGRESGS